MIDPVVAWDKLSNLETAEEIREYFHSEGIKAITSSSYSCAIAEWMRQTTGIEKIRVAGVVEVGEKKMRRPLLSDGYYTCFEPAIVFNHTRATLDFMKMFDQGKCPELELTFLEDDDY